LSLARGNYGCGGTNGMRDGKDGDAEHQDDEGWTRNGIGFLHLPYLFACHLQCN